MDVGSCDGPQMHRSGKTEVYMELISHVLDQGRQVIVLIPEISLTYQTVMRFYRRFGNRVSIINSRLSASGTTSWPGPPEYRHYDRPPVGSFYAL